MGILSFDRLKSGLRRTRESLFGKIQSIISLKPVIDDELLAHLEETLIGSDVGISTTEKLIENLKVRAREQRYNKVEEIRTVLKEEMEKLFAVDGSVGGQPRFDQRPVVVMIVGVNGVGKTTTVGKLAYICRTDGKKVLIAAADTFRAASNEQLEIWAGRAGVRIVQHTRQIQKGISGQALSADPGAVAFDALKSAIANGDDVLLIDTAGRLHTKVNLMEELKKIKRVLQKQLPEAPHEILLVLDATTGQNGIVQARRFTEVLGVTGLILTKLDGTAKGGIVFSISNELKVPVRYIGVGEGIDDLQPFDKKVFIDALFED
ncbi:MAG: signal recognition particle-docking protein FtsY [Bacteroidota bacterium]